jgi:hypothetical protein
MEHPVSHSHLVDRNTVARALLGTVLAIGTVLIVGSAGAADPAGAPPTGSALRLYRDPDTGKIGAPPPAVLADQAAQAAARAQANAVEELTEEPVAAPAGGVKVNLRGRFQPAVTRQVSRPGVIECVQPEATSHE